MPATYERRTAMTATEMVERQRLSACIPQQFPQNRPSPVGGVT